MMPGRRADHSKYFLSFKEGSKQQVKEEGRSGGKDEVFAGGALCVSVAFVAPDVYHHGQLVGSG